MSTEWKDTVICPYCGHNHDGYIVGCRYYLCDKCDKPFEIDVVLNRRDDGMLEPVRTRTLTILGVH